VKIILLHSNKYFNNQYNYEYVPCPGERRGAFRLVVVNHEKKINLVDLGVDVSLNLIFKTLNV